MGDDGMIASHEHGSSGCGRSAQNREKLPTVKSSSSSCYATANPASETFPQSADRSRFGPGIVAIVSTQQQGVKPRVGRQCSVAINTGPRETSRERFYLCVAHIQKVDFT